MARVKKLKPGDIESCPTCGGAVRVVVEDGTQYLQPVAADLRIELDRVQAKLLHAEALERELAALRDMLDRHPSKGSHARP